MSRHEGPPLDPPASFWEELPVESRPTEELLEELVGDDDVLIELERRINALMRVAEAAKAFVTWSKGDPLTAVNLVHLAKNLRDSLAALESEGTK